MSRKFREPAPADSGLDDDVEDDSDLGPSKSAVKRELAAVQQLAVRIIALPDKQRRQLPISNDTMEALAAASAMQRRAHQRQLRYAAGLLAEEDYNTVEHALQQLLRGQVEAVRQFHQVEEWRDALIDGDSAMVGQLSARFATLDRQRLMQLVREAQREKRDARPPKATRQLFRYLSDLLQPS